MCSLKKKITHTLEMLDNCSAVQGIVDTVGLRGLLMVINGDLHLELPQAVIE